jgi:hypothetical protein
MAGETLIADPYGLRTIGIEGVPPRGRVSVACDRLFNLLALHWSGSLSERNIGHQHNRASQKQQPQHPTSLLFELLVQRLCGFRLSMQKRSERSGAARP